MQTIPYTGDVRVTVKKCCVWLPKLELVSIHDYFFL